MNLRAKRNTAVVVATLMAGMVFGLPTANAGGKSGGTTPTPPPAAKSFSGRATVLNADLRTSVLHLLKADAKLVVNDTGPLPSTGGYLHKGIDVSAEVLDLLELDASVASASTAGAGNASHSSASVAKVALGVGPVRLLGGRAINIKAALLRSQASATCTANGPTHSGRSQVAELLINGQGIAVGTAPNQVISLEVQLDNLVFATVQIIINEQISARPGDITVNALHVIVREKSILNKLVADVVVSSSHADVTCAPPGEPPPPPQCPVKDFVTGGGYINDPARVSFGLVGGQKPNGLSGHVNVVDHGTGQHLKAGDLIAYEILGPTSRKLTFNGTIDGQSTEIEVTVSDNGEPGTADAFSVIAAGYSRSGTLVGGNIQLHKPDGCQTSTTPPKGRR